MKSLKRLFYLLSAVLLISSSSGCARPKPVSDTVFNSGIAVLSFEDTTRRFENSSLADLLTAELWKTEKFTKIVERRQIEKVLDEQRLGRSGDIADDTAAKVGRLLGAAYVVMGKVISANQETKQSSWQDKKGMTHHVSKREAKVMVSIKMVEVETGIVKFMDTRNGTDSNDNNSRWGDDSALYTNAVHRAIRRIVSNMVGRGTLDEIFGL